MFDDISIPEMPTDQNDAAGWITWFAACMQALIQLVMGLFGKLKDLGGSEDTTSEQAG